MPKKVVDSPTVPVTIRLGPDVVEMLRDLVGGIYGDSRAEVGKSLIRDQLDLCGINERRLFPDLDGVAAEMRRYYSASAARATQLD